MVRAGLGSARWRCRFANDFDHKKSAVYRRNWGDGILKTADVRTLATKDMPGDVDLAWASFPCQDLSLAGGCRRVGRRPLHVVGRGARARTLLSNRFFFPAGVGIDSFAGLVPAFAARDRSRRSFAEAPPSKSVRAIPAPTVSSPGPARRRCIKAGPTCARDLLRLAPWLGAIQLDPRDPCHILWPAMST